MTECPICHKPAEEKLVTHLVVKHDSVDVCAKLAEIVTKMELRDDILDSIAYHQQRDEL